MFASSFLVLQIACDFLESPNSTTAAPDAGSASHAAGRRSLIVPRGATGEGVVLSILR